MVILFADDREVAILGVEGRPIFAERLLVAGVFVGGAVRALPFEDGYLAALGEGDEVGVELGAAASGSAAGSWTVGSKDNVTRTSGGTSSSISY